MTTTVGKLEEYGKMELMKQYERVEETIATIDQNLDSPNLYEGDRDEIVKSREYFVGIRSGIIAKIGGEAVGQA